MPAHGRLRGRAAASADGQALQAAPARPVLDGSRDAHCLTTLLRRDPEALLVAEVDGRVVGTIIAGWDGWRGNLYRLAVHPDDRRRGIARALVRAAEHRLQDLGTRRCGAIVLHDNTPATGLWVAAGYEPQPEVGRFVHELD